MSRNLPAEQAPTLAVGALPLANIEPSDLAVAIRVGQRMLAAYGDVGRGDIYAYAEAHGGLAEALRILLRALDAEPASVAELHQQCRADYLGNAARRTQDHRDDAHLIADAAETAASVVQQTMQLPGDRMGGEDR